MAQAVLGRRHVADVQLHRAEHQGAFYVIRRYFQYPDVDTRMILMKPRSASGSSRCVTTGKTSSVSEPRFNSPKSSNELRRLSMAASNRLTYRAKFA